MLSQQLSYDRSYIGDTFHRYRECDSSVLSSLQEIDLKYDTSLAFCYVGLIFTNPLTTVSDLIRYVFSAFYTPSIQCSLEYIQISLRHFRAQPSTGETQESMNNVSCCCDMTEILLKAV